MLYAWNIQAQAQGRAALIIVCFISGRTCRDVQTHYNGTITTSTKFNNDK